MTSVKGLRHDYSSEYAASREGEGERDRGREDTFAFIDLWSVQRLADIEQGGWHSRKCVIGAWPVCAIVEGGHGQTPRS